MELLNCSGISYSFGATKVLDNLSMQIAQGEILGLLGRNGSGKSTLISLLIGNYPLQSGAVSFLGNKISTLETGFRENLGVVFQRPSLDNKLSVEHNLKLTARLRGVFGEESKRRIEEVMATAKISEWRHKLVGELSGGMKRRVDIARAILPGPQLLILDEPTAGLDEIAFKETWDTLKTLHSKNKVTILVVTHRPDEAEFCSRLAILDLGSIKVTGSPDVLRAKVSKDLIELKGNDIEESSRIVASMGYSPTLSNGKLLIECAEAHTVIPRIIEKIGTQNVESVSMRKATLGDVFLKMTGTSLTAEIKKS